MNEASPVRIVVAEDEDLIRNHLVKKITALDPSLHVVCAAEDGKEALEFVERRSADLVLTDIRMPVMDGIELIRALHLKYPHVRTMIATGFAEFEYARQAMRYGASEYLLKPIKPAELKNALAAAAAAIRGQRSADARSLEGLSARDGGPEEIVRLVQAFLRENYTKDLSLEEISRNFNFTPAYLSKIFLKHAGEPPSRYVISLRINEAKHLLSRQRHLSIREVGERVGYADPYYFSRIFKQVTGVSPKDFAK